MKFLGRLRLFFSKGFGRQAGVNQPAAPSSPNPQGNADVLHAEEHQGSYAVPYDENLLERARIQWQFGDWASLAKLERETLQHHPDRAKLALLAAAGHLQSSNVAVARQFIRLAGDWGCSKKLITQILVAGVHNSLGRASALAGQQPRALKHFENAIAIGNPGSEARLLTRARTNEQYAQLDLIGGGEFFQLPGSVNADIQNRGSPRQPTINDAPEK